METRWPSLPTAAWADTLETLHLYTQVVGKVRMGYGPWINHAWGVTLYVTPRGLTTGIVPHGDDAFEARLDLLDSELVVETASGGRKRVPLETTVSRFYGAVMAAFERLGLPVSIDPLPSEIAGAIPFHEDMQHGPYDPAHAQLMLRAWIDSERVMNRFRARFTGKASPVQLYWGGFDLATYRFSGRTAPPHPGGAPNFPLDVAQESYTARGHGRGPVVRIARGAAAQLLRLHVSGTRRHRGGDRGARSGGLERDRRQLQPALRGRAHVKGPRRRPAGLLRVHPRGRCRPGPLGPRGPRADAAQGCRLVAQPLQARRARRLSGGPV